MGKKSHTDKLQNDSLRASRIEAVISLPGWQDIKNIIRAKYDTLLDELLDKESHEARGGLKAIIDIVNDIDQDLEFGRVARDKYAKLKLDQTPKGE